MINFVTVNWRAYDLLQVLIESIGLYTSVPYEIIVVDNGPYRQKLTTNHVYQFYTDTNIGHGDGINKGIQIASEIFPSNPYLFVLDSDCHFLRANWEQDLIDVLQGADLAAGKGVPEKPIRAACMFMKLKTGLQYDWQDTPGYKGHRVTPDGFDVAISAYHQMIREGKSVFFLKSMPNRYGTKNGEEWSVKQHPFLYHHWHGSHLKERAVDFPNFDLNTDKTKLLSMIPWRQL